MKFFRRVWQKLSPTAPRYKNGLKARNSKKFLVAGASVGLTVLVGVSVYLYQDYIQKQYVLTSATNRLIGEPLAKAESYFQFDDKKQMYRFNEEAIKKAQSSSMDAQQSQHVGGNQSQSLSYGVEAASNGRNGVTMYDSSMNLTFGMRPQFELRAGRQQDGRLVYPLKEQPGQLIYTPRSNGFKEDIVLHESVADEARYTYTLELPNQLEARMLESGGIGIFSIDPQLLGDIATSSAEDKQRLKEVRQNADKEHLVFGIPAPVIYQTGDTPKQHRANASFMLEDDTLTLTARNLSDLSYPITIDPSIVVTSSSDFQSGNNESNISFAGDQAGRTGITSGMVNAWSDANTSSSFSTPRQRHATVVHNEYMYVIGGYDANDTYLDDVQFAPINNDGTLGAWSSTQSLPFARGNHSAVAYNGYLYVVGGHDGTSFLNDVHYASINSDGTLGSWKSTSTFTTARNLTGIVAYDSHLYIAGGYDGSTELNDVQYASVKADGNLSSWSATSSFTTARAGHGANVYNDHLYLTGGYDGANDLADVEYVVIKDDGSLASWKVTTSFPTARTYHTSVMYGGYLYVMGGVAGSTMRNDVQYAPVKVDGTVGDWRSTENFTNARDLHTSIAHEDYLYVLGGHDGTNEFNDVQYAGIKSIGESTDWQQANTMPSYEYSCGLLCTDTSTLRYRGLAFYHNDYVYMTGGQTEGSEEGDVDNVYYAPKNNDGSLGSWTHTSDDTVSASGLAGFIYDDHMYLIGGEQTGSAGWTDAVRMATINTDGSVGSFSDANSGSGLSNVIGEHTATVYNGYGYVFATNTSDVNRVEYAEILPNGTFDDWKDADATANGGSGSSFTVPRKNSQTVVAGGYAYLIGGDSYNSGVTDTVEYAAFNENGSMGSWQTTTALPNPTAHHRAFEYQGYIYVLIGEANGTSTDAVYRSKVDPSDGSLGAWETMTSFVEPAHRAMTAVSDEGYVYVLGGSDYGGGVIIQSERSHYAHLAGIGSGRLSDWTSQTNMLGTTRSGHGTVATDNHVYVIGGENGVGGLSSVEYAAINEDGSLGSWGTTSSLPKDISLPGATVYGDYIYVVGGWNESEEHIDDVYYAEIQDDGSLGSWQQTSSLSEGTRAWRGATVALDGYIYTMGGHGDKREGTFMYEVNAGTDTIYQYEVASPYDISTTSYSTSIGTQDSTTNGIAWNNDGTKLYEVGAGSDLIYEYNVSTAWDISTATFSTSISTQDGYPEGIAWNNDGTKLYEVGSLGNQIYEYNVSTAWDISTATFNTSISTQDSESSGIAWNDDGTKMYEVGTGSDLIYEYNVSTPYDITSASLSTSISTQGGDPQGIAWNNDGSKLYEINNNSDLIYEYNVSTAWDISTASFSQSIVTQGGAETGIAWNDGSAKGDKSSVEYAPINPDGTLGNWQTTADLPGARYAVAATTVNDRIYLVGGYDTSENVCLKDVLMAEPGSNGSISGWSKEARLNGSRCEHTITSYGGHLYTVGTRANGGDTTEIQRAKVYSNGALSNWDNLYGSSGLPTEIERHGSVVRGGKLYVTGGNNNNRDTYYDDVYISDIDVVDRQGRYSRVVDLGSVSEVESVSFNGGGDAYIRTKVHKACGVGEYTVVGEQRFKSTSGVIDKIFPATARSLLVSFDINANYTGTFPVASNQSVTDFTVNYETFRSPPEDRLRGGNYFANEILQPYDTLEEAPASPSGC